MNTIGKRSIIKHNWQKIVISPIGGKAEKGVGHALIKELDFDVKEEHDEEEGYVIKDEYDEHMIYGEDVNSLVHPIKDLNQKFTIRAGLA